MFKPANKLQCVIAGGLITHWKMLVYVAADTPMTLDLLWAIVKMLEDKGFRIWGCSFDLGIVILLLCNLNLSLSLCLIQNRYYYCAI